MFDKDWSSKMPKYQTICDKNSWDENLFIKMFITIIVVNSCAFFDASYDPYEKSKQLE